MNPDTMKVRKYLKECSRKEYEQVIYDSKLTPVEKTVLQYCILEGKTNEETGEILRCASRTVSKIINQAYAKIKPFI